MIFCVQTVHFKHNFLQTVFLSHFLIYPNAEFCKTTSVYILRNGHFWSLMTHVIVSHKLVFGFHSLFHIFVLKNRGRCFSFCLKFSKCSDSHLDQIPILQ